MAYGDTSEIKQVSWKIFAGSGMGEQMGYTIGDPEITTAIETSDSTTHQTRKTIIKKHLDAINPTIRFTMLETGVVNVARAVKWLSLTDAAGKYILSAGTDMIGTDLLTSAFQVRLHPMNTLDNGDDDETFLDDDIWAWKCNSVNEYKRTAMSDGDVSIDMELAVFPDFTKPAKYNIWYQGDPNDVDLSIVAPAINGVYTDTAGTIAVMAKGATGIAVGASFITRINKALDVDANGDALGAFGLYVASNGTLVAQASTSPLYTSAEIASGYAQTAGTPATTTIKLATADIQADDYYNGMMIRIRRNGVWYQRTISDYDGTANEATLSVALTISPGLNDAYEINEHKVTVTPNAALTASTVYILTIERMTDVGGLDQETNEIYPFTTAA
jgi:hypothetical protein